MVEVWVAIGVLAATFVAGYSFLYMGINAEIKAMIDRTDNVNEALINERIERRAVDDHLDEQLDRLARQIQAMLPDPQGVMRASEPTGILIGTDGESWFCFEREGEDGPLDVSIRARSVSAVRRKQQCGEVKLWLEGDASPFLLKGSGADQFWRAFWQFMGCPEPGAEESDAEGKPSRRILLEDETRDHP